VAVAAVLVFVHCTPESPKGPPDAGAPATVAAAPQSVAPKKPKIELPPPQVPPPGTEAPPAPPQIERIDDYRARVGQVLVDRQKRRVEVPGRLNMTEGILEYYAVGPQGKLHESVLELFGVPSHLHVALLLVGLDPNTYRETATGVREVAKPGGRMRLFVEWTDPKTGKPRREPAENWLYNRQKKKAPPAGDWQFLGSSFWNGQYSADQGRSIVALIPDESCVVGAVGDAGNPYRGETMGYEVNTKVVPPLHTPVTLVFEAVGDPTAPGAPGSAPAAP
jgi:hypothetical protein